MSKLIKKLQVPLYLQKNQNFLNHKILNYMFSKKIYEKKKNKF